MAASVAIPHHVEVALQTLRRLKTRTDVASFLEVSEKYLTYLLYGPTNKRAYARFAITKKTGGVRRISAPPRALRRLQEKIKKLLDDAYQPRLGVHGFVRGRSIVTNALPHVGQRWVLNVDLHAFFPSINFGRVRGMLMARPYQVGGGAATILARICCDENALPQGAATSPILANMVSARLDGQLLQLARRLKCMYTRYADDLSFSTRSRGFPPELAVAQGGWAGVKVKLGAQLTNVITANGFRPNEDKTRLQFRDRRQDVTGILVNRTPNVRRRFVREVRSMLHVWRKYGHDDAEKRFFERFDTRTRRTGANPRFRLVVKGKIDFLKMVRGWDDRVFRKLRNQLHALDQDLVKEVLPIKPDVGPIEATWKHWAKEYSHSVFLVEISKSNGDLSSGTAFGFRRGFLATAEHLLVGRPAVEAPLPKKVAVKSAGIHPKAKEGIDVAVLAVPFEHLDGPYLPIEDTVPERGEAIAVLGYPSVPQRRPALGIFSGSVESIAKNYHGHEFMMVSASLAGGMSGGPVINAAGAVVGIVVEQTLEDTALNVPGRLFHHVLPIRHIREVNLLALEDVDAYLSRKGDDGFVAGVRKLCGFLVSLVRP